MGEILKSLPSVNVRIWVIVHLSEKFVKNIIKISKTEGYFTKKSTDDSCLINL